MKTIKIKLYSYSELSEKAKEKARNDYNSNMECEFLSDNLREYIYEKLTEKGYKVEGVATSENPSIRPFYSLSYSQGDGLMFEATVIDKDGNTYTIEHRGNYYHERSTYIIGEDKEGDEIDTKGFEENIYIPICLEAKRQGYDEIEYQESEEYFTETCEANGYLFEADGTMRND